MDKLILLNELKNGPMKSKVKIVKLEEIIKLIDTYENTNFIREAYC